CRMAAAASGPAGGVTVGQICNLPSSPRGGRRPITNRPHDDEEHSMDAAPFWRDRRVLVTGCTGLVGSWTTRLLVEQGAHVVGLIRDRVAGSELHYSGTADRIDVVRGAVEDDRLIERTLAEYEVQTVLHLAAQTIVGVADRSPLSTFESNVKGTWSVL